MISKYLVCYFTVLEAQHEKEMLEGLAPSAAAKAHTPFLFELLHCPWSPPTRPASHHSSPLLPSHTTFSLWPSLSPTSADFHDYVQSPPGQARNISCSRVLHFIVSPEPLFLYAVTFHMSQRLQFGYLLERTLFRLLHRSTKELYLFDPQKTCHLKYNV